MKRRETPRYRDLLRFYAYAVVDRDSNPYFSECCICEDRVVMDDLAQDLNSEDDGKRPYRVVRLYFVRRRALKARKKR